MAKTLSNTVQGGLCNGCGACCNISGAEISMRRSDDGFLRPTSSKDLTAGQLEEFRSVCGGIELKHAPSRTYHPLWGPITELKTGHAVDGNVRFAGSSGGVITAICNALVASGRVDYVVSTSASSNDPIGNETRDRKEFEEILEASGSRYGPSSPLAGLSGYLERGIPFVFVGKPCDIASLRRLATRDERINRLIPYMLSFFCAGVPSRIGTLNVLKALGVEEPDVAKFSYRGEGWPGLTKATRKDGTTASTDYNTSWGQILNKHLQFRCKICPDGTGEFADIACADAWYGTNGYPDFTEREGRSLIVARTEAGKALLKKLENQGILSTSSLDVAEVSKMQPYQANRKRNVLARCIGMRLAGRPTPSYRGFRLPYLSLTHSLLDQLRNLYGTWRRSRRAQPQAKAPR